MRVVVLVAWISNSCSYTAPQMTRQYPGRRTKSVLSKEDSKHPPNHTSISTQKHIWSYTTFVQIDTYKTSFIISQVNSRGRRTTCAYVN